MALVVIPVACIKPASQRRLQLAFRNGDQPGAAKRMIEESQVIDELVAAQQTHRGGVVGKPSNLGQRQGHGNTAVIFEYGSGPFQRDLWMGSY